MRRLRSGWWLAVVGLCSGLLTPVEVRAQGRPEDYERADGLAARARDKVTRDRVAPHWFAGNDRFWYRVDLGGKKREFWVVDATTGERRPAFDEARLAGAMGKALGAQVDGEMLIDAIQPEADGTIRFRQTPEGKTWRFDPTKGEVTPDPDPLPALVPADDEDAPNRRRGNARRERPAPVAEVASPDGKFAAFRRGEQIWFREKASGEEWLIRAEGDAKDTRNHGVFWSPDSSKVVVVRVTPGDERRVNLVESSPPDQLQPRLSSYDYLKPGDKVAIDRPYLYDVAARKTIEVADDLFRNPWSLDRIRWDDDSQRFTFLFNQRGHQTLRVVAVNAATGQASSLIDETRPTFVDYSNKTYFEWTPQGDEILWMSERSGWNHLYRIDAATGSVRNPITQGNWLVRTVDRVDYEKRQLTMQVLGINPSEDPYHVHVIRVNFDGTGLVRLTEADGNHRVRYSPDRRFLLDTYSRVDLAPVTELRRADDGKLVCIVERADVGALDAAGFRGPERFVAKGRDGTTDIHGIIIRPTSFEAGRKYPVIEAIYAGPQGAFVPKTFRAVPANQALAELGFIVVQIDGMGTNWRSKAFHDVCAKNLADAGFPDRILWMRAAAQHEPGMDLTRVGIFGGSAGGQNALGGMLFHGDFYKAAAADCGCHDNRMDKIWWNEAWMGWPIGPHYAEQSNVTNAPKLAGPLLLTVGEVDHNVDPSSTMQVVNALIRAGKDFEFIVFPNGDHGAGGSPYGDRRRRDFFVRHLLGVEPPRRNLTSLPPASGPALANQSQGSPSDEASRVDDPAESEDW